MDHFRLSEARIEEFRRPRGRDKHPDPPSIRECWEAIQHLLSGGNLSQRRQKGLINVVDRWARANDSLALLAPATQRELADCFNAVHDVWKIRKHLGLLLGDSDKFQLKARGFLECAQKIVETLEEALIGGAFTLSEKEDKTNEDAHFFNEEDRIIGVFDGAGDTNGHLASDTACKYAENRATELSDDLSVEDLKNKMDEILRGAHHAILDKNNEAMTTAAMAKITKEKMLIFGYAADSRIYLFEKETQELIQLTLDLNPEDSVSAEDIERRWNDQKRIAELETYENVSPDIRLAIKERKLPYNFLGRPVVGKPVEPNPVICTRELKAGDIVIVMSDGIYKNLMDRRIRDCLLENPRSSQGAARALVEEAHETSKKYYDIEDKKERRNQRCSPDDMTAIVMKVE